jgi:cytochrome b involved in lipid metabolism
MLEPYDYNILLTIRHPVDAIFSYYVERFEIFKGHYPQFDMSLVQDPEMAVYRYSTFIPLLSAEQRALMETELRDDILKYQQIVSSI